MFILIKVVVILCVYFVIGDNRVLFFGLRIVIIGKDFILINVILL